MVLLKIPFFWDFTLCPVLNKFTITVPSTLESSSPRALLEPKDEGTIILQILGTIYPTTQSKRPRRCGSSQHIYLHNAHKTIYR